MQLESLSLEEIIASIKNKKTSSKEVFNYFLDRVEKHDPTIHVFNHTNKVWLQNEDINSLLAWIPIALKDNYSEKWVPTTCASNILKGYRSPFTSTVVQNLYDAWMNSIWKVNMDEFAMWSTTENSATKKTKNPWDLNRIPWGSSWWSAAWVAAWLFPAALGSDTWWSIRQPASLCWVVWFKPSYWRNSRYWVVAMGSSLDCPWTLTKTVKDAWILYNIMNWHDPLDSTSIQWKDILDESIWNKKSLKWIKLWLPKEYFWEGLDEGVRNTVNSAIKHLKSLWAEIVDIELPMTKYALPAYYIIMPAEVSTNLSRFDGIRFWATSPSPYENLEEFYFNNRGEWLGEEAQRRIILWSFVLSAWYYDAYYKKASEVRTLIIQDFNNAFEKVDAIIWPVSPSVAWKIWEKVDDPMKMYLSDVYTVPASLAWLPWISVPCWFAKSEDSEKKELPVWLHILTPQFQESKLFEIAHTFQQSTDFHKKSPSLD